MASLAAKALKLASDEADLNAIIIKALLFKAD